MIKDLIYELSISEQSETVALGIALTCSRETESRLSLTFLKPVFQFSTVH